MKKLHFFTVVLFVNMPTCVTNTNKIKKQFLNIENILHSSVMSWDKSIAKVSNLPTPDKPVFEYIIKKRVIPVLIDCLNEQRNAT